MSLNQKSIHYIDLFITFIALSPCRVKPRMFCSGYQWFLILIGRLTKKKLQQETFIFSFIQQPKL